jgi:hypothetical protein
MSDPLDRRPACPLPFIGELVTEISGWEYPWHHNRGGVCLLRVWKSASFPGHVAVVTEIPDNPGVSVTNAAEFILDRLHAAFPGPLVVMEHYHRETSFIHELWAQERLARVYREGATMVSWQPVWPCSPAHPEYEAHLLWAQLYFEQVTGCPPQLPDAACP